jgi:CBS domain-containing protein
MISRMASDARSLLTRVPGCRYLGGEALRALTQAAESRQYAPGDRLVVEGEPAPDWYCLVAAGVIHVSRSADGADGEDGEAAEDLTAGDVLDPGLPGSPAECTAVASRPTRCLLVPQSAVARCRGQGVSLAASPYGGEAALFVRRVADLVKGPPVTSDPDTSIAEAARLMTARGVGSLAILGEDGTPVGIVTDRDLRAKVVARGLPSTTPVSGIMSSPLVSLAPERPAFDALLEMTRRGIHHLGVAAHGRLVGVVSSHDIVLLQGAHPVGLMREIDAQGDLAGLATVAPRVQTVVRWLADQGASAYDIGRIVAELNDRLVRHALPLVAGALEAEGHGRPPLPYAWLAGGSEGRREQTLRTDQDNGLVYEDPPAELGPVAAEYFGRLAGGMEEALARLGFPRCEGGFMASNPRWCQPESVWLGYFASWMQAPDPTRVLSASLFFDLRPVAGHQGLGRELWEWVCEHAPASTLFLRQMARAALERHVPLGVFGRFVVERSGPHKDMLDLKARGVFPVTQGMRVCALSLGVRETNTVDRLVAVSERGLFEPAELQGLRDAYEVITRMRLHHQLACLDAGRPPDNFIDPRVLAQADRVLLKQAFRAVARMQHEIEHRFQTETLA